MKILYPYVLILLPILWAFVNKKNFFYILSASFIVIAISGVAKVSQKEIKTDKDIYFIFDTTYSMACKDLKPDRLEYAKKEFFSLIKKLKKPVGVFSFDKEVKFISFPTTDYEFLKQKIEKLKPVKASTDIKMAINRVKAVSNGDKIIVLISDGGEKKVQGDFVFWGFATEKGAKVPGFDAISKLNIIGKKYFAYNEGDKLLKYLKKQSYTTKKITTYKRIDYIFVVLAFISFLLGGVYNRFVLILLIFLIPRHLYAGDFLGCLYEKIGLQSAALSEFKKSGSDFAKIKLATFYMKNGELKKAYNLLKDVKGYEKIKNYDMALILTKMKKYKKAYELVRKLKEKYSDERIDKLYDFVSLYKNEDNLKTIIIPTKKTKSSSEEKTKSKNDFKNLSIKKEPLW